MSGWKMMIVFLCAAAGVAIVSCRTSLPTDGSVFSPQVQYDSVNNQYLVMYERRLLGENKPAILYAKRLDASGSAKGAEFAVSGEVGGPNAFCYASSYDSQNQRFLVAWSEVDRTRGRLVNADGTLFGPAFIIADTASCPSLAYDSVRAKFLVAWATTSANVGVFARVLNADGTPGGSQTLLSNNLLLKFPDDGPVSAAFNADTGGFLILIRDAQTLSAIAVNFDGTPAGAAVISTATDRSDRSVVIYNSLNRRYLVSWSNYDRLRGQFLNPDATLRGVAFDMSGSVMRMQHHAIAFDFADQRYLEVYDSNRGLYSSDFKHVFGLMLDASATLQQSASENQFLISLNDFPGANRPSIAFNSVNRNFLVVWEFNNRDARYPDIQGRTISADGSVMSDIFNIALGSP